MLRILVFLVAAACSTSHAPTPTESAPPPPIHVTTPDVPITPVDAPRPRREPRCERIVSKCSCSVKCGNPDANRYDCAVVCDRIDQKPGMRCVVRRGVCQEDYDGYHPSPAR